MIRPLNSFWYVAASLVIIGMPATCAHAEIIPADGGAPLSGPNYQIPAQLGSQRGGNLFHWFSVFNLDPNESAEFAGPLGVRNIITTVNGGESSLIDGALISTIPGANLYFINPHGLAFGPHAKLDIQGSLYASSADQIILADGGIVDAHARDQSTLSSAAPAAFGFLGGAPAPIHANQADLSVPGGNTLALVGGDIELTQSSLSSEDGSLVLVALGSGGLVDLGAAPGAWSDNFHDLGDIIIHGGSASSESLRATGEGFGSIVLRGEEITLVDARLVADSHGVATGGSIDVWAKGSLTLSGDSQISSVSELNGTLGGTILLRGEFIKLSGNSAVETSTLNAGKAGNITIESRYFSMSDQATITSFTLAQGHAGDVVINADTVSLAGVSSISSATANPGAGYAGNIDIYAKSVDMTGGTTINISALNGSDGNVGNIRVHADSIVLGDHVLVIALNSGGGEGGLIELQAKTIRMDGHATLGASTLAVGDASDVILAAEHINLAEDSQVLSGTNGKGDGGNIFISSDLLVLEGNTVLGADSEGESSFVLRGSLGGTGLEGGGRGGAIFIEAGNLHVSGNAMITSGSNGSGDGGDISLFADTARVTGKASVSAKASASGRAGTVTISGTLIALDGGAVTTKADVSDGGDIVIQGDDLVFLDAGAITTSVGGGEGNGGNMAIGGELIVLRNGRIEAETFGGRGGNITFSGGHVIRDPDSSVSAAANAAHGVDGEVIYQAPVNELSGALVSLSTDFFRRVELRASNCAQRESDKTSSFYMTQRGGVPTDPELATGMNQAAALEYEVGRSPKYGSVSRSAGQVGECGHPSPVR